MAMTSALRTGELGVTVELPSRLSVVSEDESFVQLMDPDTGVGWHFMTFPGLPFDVSHREELGLAAEPYARAMFDDLFHQRAATSGLGAREPRTHDPAWTPMVELEVGTHDGCPVLRTIHRLAYQPGLEIVMGHLLVPARPGLFEVRATAIDHTTGLRESALGMIAMNKAGPDAETPWLSQKEMDDPRHDEAFPQHALSRARAAMRWLSSEAGLRITAPAIPAVRGEVSLPRLGCALVPPPRFVHGPDAAQRGSETFVRSSFCGTDGLEHFLVSRVEAGPRRPEDLRAWCEGASRRLHEESGVADIQMTSEPAGDAGQVLVIVEGRGHLGRLRNAFWWFLDGGRAWSLSVTGTAAVPAATRAGELRAAGLSWRSLSGPPAGRPWWKVW